MLLVAAETINRTCIATLLYLIANVSLPLISNYETGLGHYAFLL